MTLDLLIPLVTGHLVGDFLLQTDGIARNKSNRRVLLAHCGIVAVTSWILTGHLRGWWWMVPILLVSHFVIDLTKAGGERWLTAREASGTRGFIDANGSLVLHGLDQAAHLGVIGLLVAGARAAPRLQATVAGEGLWVQAFGSGYLSGLLLVSGGILATVACGHFLGLLLRRFEAELTDAQKGGLKKGGYWIGVTERSLIYLFILVGEPTGIGFLAAAKSVFRIGELKEAEDRKLAEYILIGTLLSFASAMVVGLLVREALSTLP